MRIMLPGGNIIGLNPVDGTLELKVSALVGGAAITHTAFNS
jgi:hypothetical protein